MLFESPYMTSYSTTLYALSLSSNLFGIFDFKLLGFDFDLWPLKVIMPFESSYLTSCSSSINTIPSLYLVPSSKKCWSTFGRLHKMAEFDLFKVLRIDFSYKSHWWSHKFILGTISLSWTLFKKMLVNILKVAQNGRIWPFQGPRDWFFIQKAYVEP